MSLKMRVHGELVTLTDQTILKTNKWYADNAQGCIDEAVSGTVFVNNLDQYIEEKTARKAQFLSGDFKLWLGYYQQAYFIQTGQDVPILS